MWFFNHLLTAMKCPTLIASIARDLDQGHAIVLQVVSTNEALLDRRLAEIPVAEWGDLSIDITPREYVLDYLNQRLIPLLPVRSTSCKGGVCGLRRCRAENGRRHAGYDGG